MKISFDLDKTLVQLRRAEKKIWKKHKVKFKPSCDWNLSNVPKEIKIDILNSYKDPKVMGNLKPFKFAKQLIKRLYKEGHEVIIVTSRHECIRDATRKMIKRLFGDIKVFFTDFNESKLKILLKEKADFFIDDCPNELLNYEKNGIDVIMISNDYTPYNFYLRDKIFWVKDVEYIYKHIKFFDSRYIDNYMFEFKIKDDFIL